MLKDAKIISTDADLSQLLNSLKLSLAAIHTVKNIDDVIGRAMQQTSIYVGELLLRQEAFFYLLSTTHSPHLLLNVHVQPTWMWKEGQDNWLQLDGC